MNKLVMPYGIFLILASVFLGCSQEYTPKPKAYARVHLPKPNYIPPDSAAWDCPYHFTFSNQAVIAFDPRYQDSTCWYNLYYPQYKATLHLTYYSINNNLGTYIEQNRKLAMKHISKASKIEEIVVSKKQERVYGIVYDFKGETASDLQFFLTDSTNHMLRGSLYFNVVPNKDSLAPVIGYVKKDINHFIESLTWTDQANR